MRALDTNYTLSLIDTAGQVRKMNTETPKYGQFDSHKYYPTEKGLHVCPGPEYRPK